MTDTILPPGSVLVDGTVVNHVPLEGVDEDLLFSLDESEVHADVPA